MSCNIFVLYSSYLAAASVVRSGGMQQELTNMEFGIVRYESNGFELRGAGST